jgi:hypothetical protein
MGGVCVVRASCSLVVTSEQNARTPCLQQDARTPCLQQDARTP